MSSRLTFGIAAVLWVSTVSAQSALEVPLSSGSSATVANNADREVSVDLGSAAGTPEDIRAGLFPEDLESPQQRKDRERCERLIASGFKCMPPLRTYTRFNLPGVSFATGKSDLPELMKQQLKSFADVLRGRSAAKATVRIEGHADASGDPQINIELSKQRAEAVRNFLVSLGVSQSLLETQGFGAKQLRNPADPAGAENRRVEIARALPQ